MKTLFLLAGTLLFYINSFSTVGPASLYTKDMKYYIDLRQSVWRSMNDGEKIIFDNYGMSEEISGRFSNGVTFYSEFVFGTWIDDQGIQRSACSDVLDNIKIEFKGGSNVLRLVQVKGKWYIKDKRGLLYILERGKVQKVE